MRLVSVSGGKDSTALYLWAIENFGQEFTPIFSDTGHEHPVTYNYLRNLPEMAKGPEITWVKADFSDRLKKKDKEASGNPFLDLMLWKGRAPSSKAQFCTEHLKLAPIRDFIGDQDAVIYTGIRAGESERRSKMAEREFLPYYDAWTERPLLRWTEEQVFKYLESKGVPPNPLYAFGFSRVGCYPCIHARKSELVRLEDWAWDKLEYWEKTLGRTWFSAGTAPFTDAEKCEISEMERQYPTHQKEVPYDEATGETETVTSEHLRLHELKIKLSIKTVNQIREWAKTTRGGKQFDLFAEDAKDVPSCMSTWGICE